MLLLKLETGETKILKDFFFSIIVVKTVLDITSCVALVPYSLLCLMEVRKDLSLQYFGNWPVDSYQI